MSKFSFILLTASILLLAATALSQQDELRSRGFLGVAPRAVTQADQDSLGLPDTKGAIIAQVVPNSPAERAGLRVGDVVLKFDDRAILNETEMIARARCYYAGDRIRVALLRNGQPCTVDVQLDELARESSQKLDIRYTSFLSNGVRLRTVITSPLNSAGKPLPALLIVSALNNTRLIALPGYSVMRELAYRIAKAGLRVMRFEMRGAGDSEGEDYRRCDFDTELQDNVAALHYLRARDDVDSKKIFVFGISTGGIVAAKLAATEETAGLITSNTVGRTYYERTVETLRTQVLFGGGSEIDTEQRIKDYLELMMSVARGDSLSSIVRKNPRLRMLVNSSGRIMDDRSPEYWRQQLNLNLAEVYSRVVEPVLIVYGESDFLTQRACHENIRNVLVRAGNPDVTLAVVPDADHTYAYAKSKKESFDNYKTRTFRPNPAAFDEIVKWLKAHITG
jgi:alpha-beta hydrolase superfamily lysophospholipase